MPNPYWDTRMNRRIEQLRGEGYMTLSQAAANLGLTRKRALEVLGEPDIAESVGGQVLGMWRRDKVCAHDENSIDE